MTKQLLSFIILGFMSFSLPAQTVRTGVLVIGNNAGSIAASIQSARSGAKTMLLTESVALQPDLTAENLSYLERIVNHYRIKTQSGGQDTSLNLSMGAEQYIKLIKSIIDTTKNLSLSLNSAINRIQKSGKGWDIRMKNGQRIKADVLVDATEKLSIASILGINTNIPLSGENALATPVFESTLFRSTVARAYKIQGEKQIFYPLSIGDFIPAGTETFVFIPLSTNHLKQVAMSAGQAAGTIASYCAFFKTTTKNINVRLLQGELFVFDAELIPMEDINRDDPNFLAFQRMAASGLLRPSFSEAGNKISLRFDTAGAVTAAEIRAPMKEFYSRSQIWFADHQIDTLTIEDTVHLLMFTATRGEELTKEIEAAWKESFKFNTIFDPKRPISRKEFTILADTYLQPFNVRINFRGKLLS